MALPAKPVAESAINDQTAIVFPNDINVIGTLYGGRAMEMADEVAAIVAKRHSGVTCVTLGIDSVRFLAPARHGDILIFKAAVNRVWRTSLEVGLKEFADDFHTSERKHIVSAYFTFVAVDNDMKPVAIPAIVPETEDEKRRFATADDRPKARMRSATAT